MQQRGTAGKPPTELAWVWGGGEEYEPLVETGCDKLDELGSLSSSGALLGSLSALSTFGLANAGRSAKLLSAAWGCG